MEFLIALSLLTFNAHAHEKSCVFAPKNDLKIAVGEKSKRGAGIDEATYNSMIDRVENFYKPIVAAKGATLVFNRMWTTDTVNSTAHQSGKKWYVDAYGGLARYPIMTADAEAAVLCHEMGHHIGGFPKGKGVFGTSSWASNEGQADYFATMKCFRRVFENDDNVSVMSNVTIPKEVTKGCENTFKSQKEIALCERESMAGKVLAQVLWELGRGSSKVAGEPSAAPSFETPSTATVSTTDDQHPLAQCRLDTYFNGSICGMAATDDFGVSDAATGACAEEKGDKYGFRPRCWFKPKL